MAFTDAEKTDIRRFCGYPVYGGQPVQAFGYRFLQHYGTLEFKLNNLQTSEEAVVRGVYLTNLATLETAIPLTSDNLDTDQAAVWTHNKKEQRDREQLFDSWRRRLCDFLGIPPGPGLSAKSAGGIEFIV